MGDPVLRVVPSSCRFTITTPFAGGGSVIVGGEMWGVHGQSDTSSHNQPHAGEIWQLLVFKAVALKLGADQ